MNTLAATTDHSIAAIASHFIFTLNFLDNNFCVYESLLPPPPFIEIKILPE